MLDRIKITKNIKNSKKYNEVKNNIKRLGKFINIDVNRFANKYLIINKLFRLEFYPISGTMVIDFNIARVMNGINHGEVKDVDIKRVVESIDNFLEIEVGLRTNILEWDIKSVEIKKDFKYANGLMAQEIINTYKKCTKANLKTLDFNTSYYRYNKAVKVCCYRKDQEIKAKGKWNELTEKQKDEIKNVVRFEVELTNKKLCSILKIKKITLKDILNPFLQAIIHKSFFATLSFTDKLLTKEELEKRIKALPFQKRKIRNILKVINALNKMSFKKVKEKFSSVYKYLSILKEFEICPYWIDINIQKNKEIKFLNCMNVLKDTTLYNIYTLIYYFKNIDLKLRI